MRFPHHSYLFLGIFIILVTLSLCTAEKPTKKGENNQRISQTKTLYYSKRGDHHDYGEEGVIHKIRDKIHKAKKEAVDFFKGGKAKVKVNSKQRFGFIHAFLATLSFIVISELGDKTFFIAAIMAMRHSRVTVFAGAIGALGAMTVLSAVLGYATTVIPRKLTYYASSILFAVFGIKMIREGWYMASDQGVEEYEEAQAEIRKCEEDDFHTIAPDAETGVIHRPNTQTRVMRLLRAFFSKTLLESFTLTFLAEWGDRSQITTIVLAAREDVVGVIIGGTLGHALCTGLAVLGGRFVAQRISVRTVTLIGGVLFLLFALSALFIGPDSNS